MFLEFKKAKFDIEIINGMKVVMIMMVVRMMMVMVVMMMIFH